MSHVQRVHLSLQTDYALRILMLLASNDRQMSVDEIARSYGISRNHLAKVTQRLQASGYVETSRGRGGGLRLAIPAKNLNVGAVVRELENLETFVECMTPARNTCPAFGVCGLQNALGLALGDFLNRLDGYTVADLVPDPVWFSEQVGRGPLTAR
jgi:Rrf2 family nitric oxide-sensitive transcriptional repressor